jgi:hypothetical protein
LRAFLEKRPARRSDGPDWGVFREQR